MVDFSKPVQTRDGRPVRILATDLPDDKFPVLAIEPLEGGYSILKVTAEGRYWADWDRTGESRNDLVNVPVETVTYRSFARPGRGKAEAGISTYEGTDARAATGLFDLWEGVLKFTEVDGKLTAVELVSE